MKTLLAKLCVTGLAVLLLVSLTSCGGGSGGVVVDPTGDMLITNDAFSFFIIDFVEINGPEFLQIFPFILPGDSVLIPDVFSGTYSVTIGWTDATQDVFFPVDVFSGATTEVTGFN